MPRRYTIVIILIIAIAVFFRFWQFTSIPAGLYQDEAMNGADALTSLKTGEFKVFYPDNNGREGMIVWLDAMAIKAFGTEPWVLRLFPALAGVLAVLGLYFLTKELFGAEVALASSFFMAVSFWAVNFSRMGFRAGLMVPILVWSFYLLLTGFRLQKYIYFIIAGVLFGLGFYTYIPFRFAPILVLLIFAPLLFKQKSKHLWISFSFFILTVFIVALPIGLYFLHNPTDFFGRSSGVSVFSQDSPIKAMAISIITTLGMFNIAGDFNWRHNYAGSPELFLPVGILFLLGICLSIKRFRFEERFLFNWFIIFLLPNFLTIEGNPHALRAIGVIPVVMIFSGIGLIWLYKKAQNYVSPQLLRLKKEIFLLLIIFLFFVGGYNFNLYFTRWASNPNVANAFSQNQVKIAGYLNNLPKETKKYVLWHPDDRLTDNGLPVSAQTVYFLTTENPRLRQGFGGQAKINYLRADEINKIKPENNSVIIPIYYNLDLLHNLNKQFSQSKINFIDINTAVLLIP